MSALLNLRGVSRTFDRGSVGIRDVTLSIEEGEFVAIVGPSGAGKSTLLNVLGLLEPVESGTYSIDGRHVGTLSERERDHVRGSTFGFVFQSAHVLGDESAATNVALGMRTLRLPARDRSEAATAALQRVGLDDRGDARAATMSGGERQRVALARAVAHAPRVIFADEPTGSLDTTNSARVMEVLTGLHQDGATVVMVTHDLSVAALASRTIEIVDGRIVSDASRADNAADVKSGAPRPNLTAGVGHTSLWAAIVDDLADALAAMAHRATRTILLAAAFAVGIGGFVAAVGIAESAANQVSERLSAAALDEVRVTVPLSLAASDVEQLGQWVASAADIDRVEHAGSYAQVGGDTANVRRDRTSDTPGGLTVAFADLSYLELMGVEPVAPRSYSLWRSPPPHSAVLGVDAAAALHVPTPGPGMSVWVGNQRVDVVAIVESGDRGDVNDAVFVSPDVIAAQEPIVTIVVRTEVGAPAAVADALPIALDPSNPGRFSVETVADLRALRFGVSNDLGILVGAVAALLIILSALTAATTLFVSVQARGAEISLRRAIGASRFDIARIFLIEGMLVGCLGGAIGGCLGVGATIAVALARDWVPVLPPTLSVVGVALGVATGACAALVPAIDASRRAPALGVRV